VLPSLWESLANAALEALDMGKPVVATLGSGFEEVIEHGRSGLLVRPGDVDGLRTAMAELCADPVRLRRMSEACLARAADFALDRAVDNLVAVYESVLGRPALVAA
jgi:phosphatidylinositol alpha 1,6-mannosyltransferase